MGKPFSGSNQHQVFVSLVLVAAVVGIVCDLFMMYLIRKMKAWNGHILLILTITVFQLLYDVSFFPAVVNTGYYNLFLTASVCQFVGGIASSIFSNCVAFVALYVVYYKKAFDIFKYYYISLVLALLPCAAISIVFLLVSLSHNSSLLNQISPMQYTYTDVRLGSIALNFIFSFMTFYFIKQMGSGKTVKSRSETVINDLAVRLLFYPIVQAVGRSGLTTYEILFGFDFDEEHASPGRYAALMIMVVTTPLISVGYLLIFLKMQPGAMVCAKAALCFNEYTPRIEIGSSGKGSGSRSGLCTACAEDENHGEETTLRRDAGPEIASVIPEFHILDSEFESSNMSSVQVTNALLDPNHQQHHNMLRESLLSRTTTTEPIPTEYYDYDASYRSNYNNDYSDDEDAINQEGYSYDEDGVRQQLFYHQRRQEHADPDDATNSVSEEGKSFLPSPLGSFSPMSTSPNE